MTTPASPLPPTPATAAGPAPSGPARAARLSDLLIASAAVLVCALCLSYLAIRHVVWPRLDHWRPQLVAFVSRVIDRPLTVGELRPGWEGLHPTLLLDSVQLAGPDGTVRFEAASAFAKLSWRSLIQGHPRLEDLRLQAPRLDVVRLANGRIEVAGFLLPDDGKINEPILEWLMSQGLLSAREGSVRLIAADGAWPLQRLDGVSIDIRNAGRRHEASSRVERAFASPGTLNAVLAFERPPLSRRPDWQRWKGDLHLASERLPARALASLVTPFVPAWSARKLQADGSIDQLTWGRFEGGRIMDARFKLGAQGLQASWSGARVDLQSLHGELAAQARTDSGHDLSLTDVRLLDSKGFRLAGAAQLELDAGQARAVRTVSLQIEPVEAGPLLEAARRAPLPAGVLRTLAPLAMEGRLRDIDLKWAAPATQGQMPPSRLSANFDQLGLKVDRARGPRALPGFRNLSGSVEASASEGTITLTGDTAVVSLPGVFEDPDLAFDRLEGEFNWKLEGAAGDRKLHLLVPRLSFASVDGTGTARAEWRGNGKGPGWLDLSGRIDRARATRIARYLPLVFSPALREWVDNALVSGTGEDFGFEVHGDLRDFPFRDPATGRFRIAGRVRDTTLAYSPTWPRIEQIQGELEFSRGGMEVNARSGQIRGVRLSDVRARVADYRDRVLSIEGQGSGPAQDMILFIDDSPLAASIATFTRDVSIAGDARLGLSLTLPLADLDQSRVRGSVDFSGNDLVLDRTLPAFGALTGRLEFTDQGLSLQGLRANFLGGPLRVDGRSVGEGRMHIDASGSIDAQGMRRLVDNPLTRRLEGRTDYRVSIDVERRSSSLTLESDLAGLSSSLPEPFAKAADEVWPLKVVSHPLVPGSQSARPPGDRLDVRLRDRMGLIVERERDPASERLRIRRAGFAIGEEPALRDSGLSVLMRTREFDFDAWRTLLSDGELERLQKDANDAAMPGMALVPDLVSIVADDLRIGGRDLHEVVLGASRSDTRWRANIASREIVGHFDWRDARPGERIGTLSARFDRLVLTRAREGEIESALSAPPERLPALDIVASELVLGEVPLGRLALTASNGGNDDRPVWRLERLSLDNPSARLDATGVWSFARPQSLTAQGASADARRTALQFSLAVHDAGSLLDRIGVKDALRGGQGSLQGDIVWKGSPLAIDYPSLDGHLHLALGKGAFLRVDPGPAKLVAVLNLQSLRRLLTGQMRDIFAEGFAFDAIEGDVRLDRGVAQADGLRMRGPQATVNLTGTADLQRETQDLRVRVLPEIDVGLASIAVGAMVNPVIGLGSLAAQTVLRRPLQEALGFDIDITGSWADPTVSERARLTAPAPVLQP